jgi:hypothetical protein
MVWKPETAGRRKIAFVVAALLLVCSWGMLLSWLVRNYHVLPSEERYLVMFLLVMYPVPGIQTMVERPQSASMVTLTYLTLMFAVEALWYSLVH